MTNSAIIVLALLVWTVFTLFYFRQEISGAVNALGNGHDATPKNAPSSVSMEDCLGVSRQSAVAKAAPAPVQEPAAGENTERNDREEEVKQPDVVPEPVAFPEPESEPEPSPAPEPVPEAVPDFMPAKSMPMAIVDVDDEWIFEQQDMQQALEEERLVTEVEQNLRQPYRSEKDDRQTAEKLHGLQDLEIFNALRHDSRLRTDEILAKYPPLPQEPLPQEDVEEDPEEEVEEADNAPEEEAMTEEETAHDDIQDFLS
ncbi:MAG: hypothetical protein NC048_02645 [Bacteroides sp.]|nr:hypothetical protein [Bacteroides sp.]MCM1531462.1 hypothetical protein [Ruminococcus flavefaciens]MCM1554376.1 hypothetical protein [Bacteroides sp.]